MSRNKLYANEMATASRYIEDSNKREDFYDFMAAMRLKGGLTHSDRWSMCYDWLAENCPDAPGSVVTGLAYLLEE